MGVICHAEGVELGLCRDHLETLQQGLETLSGSETVVSTKDVESSHFSCKDENCPQHGPMLRKLARRAERAKRSS